MSTSTSSRTRREFPRESVSVPRSRMARARRLPRKPAPPVITTRIFRILPGFRRTRSSTVAVDDARQRGYRYSAWPAAIAIACASVSACSSASARSRASTITRSTGSVPDGRSSTRPASPSAATATRSARRHRSLPRQSQPRLHRHVDEPLRKQRRPARSLRRASCAARSARAEPRARRRSHRRSCACRGRSGDPNSRRRAASRVRMQLLEHVAVADLGAHAAGCHPRAAPARSRGCSSACRRRRRPARRAAGSRAR